MPDHSPVIIVGAGLSGLYLAWRLQQLELDVQVLEARDRAGGRMLSTCIEQGNSCFDLGPAWIWPQYQTRLKNLIEQLEINHFKQFTTGNILYESGPDSIEKYSGPSSHTESWRLDGGCKAVTDALVDRISVDSIQLNSRVESIQASPLTVSGHTDGESFQYLADRVVLAMPPALIQQSIVFNPPMSEQVSNSWQGIPTWMATHCKIVFIYSRPFWKEQGLSGEVFSRYGPLIEIYDATPVSKEYYALTSFVGLNAQQRAEITDEKLIQLSLQQLQRLFGKESQNTIDIQLKDWNKDEFTCHNPGVAQPSSHPYYPENVPRSFYNSRLVLAGTETARQHAGYLEGALESAEDVLKLL